MPKYYTLKEANEALVTVRPMVGEMMRIGEIIRAYQPELWALAQKVAGNGGSQTLTRLLPEFDKLRELLHKVQDMGIEVKDLTIGLIDFRTLRYDKEVYLCWQFGEGDIRYWHEIEAGFAGRQLIDWD
jgi:hypothetical protein